MIVEVLPGSVAPGVPVTAFQSGRVWLLFSTDAGFEGRTEIHFTRVSVTSMPARANG